GLTTRLFFLGFQPFAELVCAAAGPTNSRIAAARDVVMEVHGQNHESQGKHPEAKDRQEREQTAKNQTASEQDPFEFGSGQPNRAASKADAVTCRPGVGHLLEKSLPWPRNSYSYGVPDALDSASSKCSPVAQW